MNKVVFLCVVLMLSMLVWGCAPEADSSGASAFDQTGARGEETSGGGAVKEFDVDAVRYEFQPDTITVNEGDTVIMHVTSIDVDHGIAIPDFGVSERLAPGDTVDIEFVADQAGTFTFFCDVYCGSGHGAMRGTLVVE